MILKNCIIIHGCPASEKEFMEYQTKNFVGTWIGSVRTELMMRGITTKSPIMPRAFEPTYERYRYEMGKHSVNENTTLVGHSCGCSFLVRYLGDTKKKIDKLILVAPSKIAVEGDKFKADLYNFEIDESIKTRVKKIVIFTSDNDNERCLESAKIFAEKLGAEVITIPGYGHYKKEDMQTDKFPELTKIILS